MAENPHDFATRLKYPDILLVGDGELLVDEKVGEFLESPHAKRTERIASTPMAKSERIKDLVGIEMRYTAVSRELERSVVGEMPNKQAHRTEEVGLIHLDVELAFFDLTVARLYDDVVTVDNGSVRRREEYAAPTFVRDTTGNFADGISRETFGKENFKKVWLRNAECFDMFHGNECLIVDIDNSTLDELLDLRVEDLANIVEMVHVASHSGKERRIDGLEMWDNIVTNTVTRVGIRSVGGVGDILELVCTAVKFNLLTRELEERTYDAALLSLHARESTNARTADKVENKRFRCVVSMMGYSDTLERMLIDETMEPLVTEFASRHLDRDTVLRSIILGVKMHDMEWHTKFGAIGTDKLLIAVGLIATEMEITVSGHTIIAVADQIVKKGDTISATTYGDEYALVFVDESLLFHNSHIIWGVKIGNNLA